MAKPPDTTTTPETEIQGHVRALIETGDDGSRLSAYDRAARLQQAERAKPSLYRMRKAVEAAEHGDPSPLSSPSMIADMTAIIAIINRGLDTDFPSLEGDIFCEALAVNNRGLQLFGGPCHDWLRLTEAAKTAAKAIAP